MKAFGDYVFQGEISGALIHSGTDRCAYYVPGSILGTEGAVLNNTGMVTALLTF